MKYFSNLTAAFLTSLVLLVFASPSESVPFVSHYRTKLNQSNQKAVPDSVNDPSKGETKPSSPPDPTFLKLKQQVFDLFQTTEFDASSKKAVQVKTQWTGANVMTTLAKGITTDHTPQDFEPFLDNFAEAFPKINPICKSIHFIQKGGSNREGIKSYFHLPFPLQDRVMVSWKYVQTNLAKDEHLLIMSEENNQDMLQEHYHGSADEKSKVLGRTFLCAYWIRPIYANNNKGKDDKPIGSEVLYCFSGDIGGSVPTFIQNTIGPKTASDSVKGLLDSLRKEKKSKLSAS